LEKLGYLDPEGEAERIFSLADIDGSDQLEFKEWCAAAMDKDKLLCSERLEATFNMLDRDGDGTISVDEIKSMLKIQDDNEATFVSMVNEMDLDGDGEITFAEFEYIMKQLLR